jgi:hypothetical protein
LRRCESPLQKKVLKYSNSGGPLVHYSECQAKGFSRTVYCSLSLVYFNKRFPVLTRSHCGSTWSHTSSRSRGGTKQWRLTLEAWGLNRLTLEKCMEAYPGATGAYPGTIVVPYVAKKLILEPWRLIVATWMVPLKPLMLQDDLLGYRMTLSGFILALVVPI